MLHPPPDNKRDTTASGEAGVAGHALHALVLSLSHGLESLRRQLHEQHAAGEALRADLAAQTDANTALLGDADALRAENEELRSKSAAVDSRAHARREIVAELQERIGSLEAMVERLQALVEPVSPDDCSHAELHAADPPVANPPAAPARTTVVMPPMHFNVDATNLWDRLPNDLQAVIFWLSGDLTRMVNGLLPPLKIKTMRYYRGVDLWIDAMECDWQGDLRLLPKPAASHFEHAIRTCSMLERVQKLSPGSQDALIHTALMRGWDYSTLRGDIPLECIAACAGRLDILQNIFESSLGAQPGLKVLAFALAAGQFIVFDWLVKLKERKYPLSSIPAHMFNPSIHRLLMSPPQAFVARSHRAGVLLDSEQRVREQLATHARLADPVVLEIAFLRFGAKLDFSAQPLRLHNIGMLKWARSHGLTRDKAKVAENIATSAKSAKTAQWARTHLGIEFKQDNLAHAAGKNNMPLVMWLLAQPGIRIDEQFVQCSVVNLSLDAISLQLAREPSLSGVVVVAAVEGEIRHAEHLEKLCNSKAPIREFFDWLGVCPSFVLAANSVAFGLMLAIKHAAGYTTAFLLERARQSNWDLHDARTFASEFHSNALHLGEFTLPQGIRLAAGSATTIRFNGAPWRGIGEDSVHCRRLLLAVIASMARSGRRLVASAQISAVWRTPSLVFEAWQQRRRPAHARRRSRVDAALAACGISASKSHFAGVPEWSLKAMDWTASGAPAAAARGLVLSLLEAMHAAGCRIVASCRATSTADQCDTLVFGRSA
ncbi:hypothetical protein HK105_205663 [Polyrhizophydium stewartii]|uniref:Uncharacterized protein n=1 Tax=Polyrhizophydium stewartii TaxID=2732419 RepID=A0ABR4N5D7_9FUNG